MGRKCPPNTSIDTFLPSQRLAQPAVHTMCAKPMVISGELSSPLPNWRLRSTGANRPPSRESSPHTNRKSVAILLFIKLGVQQCGLATSRGPTSLDDSFVRGFFTDRWVDARFLTIAMALGILSRFVPLSNRAFNHFRLAIGDPTRLGTPARVHPL